MYLCKIVWCLLIAEILNLLHSCFGPLLSIYTLTNKPPDDLEINLSLILSVAQRDGMMIVKNKQHVPVK